MLQLQRASPKLTGPPSRAGSRLLALGPELLSCPFSLSLSLLKNVVSSVRGVVEIPVIHSTLGG